MKRHAFLPMMVVLGLGLLLGLVVAGTPSSPVSLAAPAASTRYAIPGGLSSGDCISWTNACELWYALGTVAVSGDEIWVAAGTYKPTAGSDRSISFVLKGGVAIYGGFAATETLRTQRDWETHVTTLSGDIGTPGVNTDNSYHVVTGSTVTETAVVDGFTISGGNANGGSPHNEGGGMHNDQGSPTLANVRFDYNTATSGGGGMHNGNNGNPTLTDCTFFSNTSTLDGGGMHNHPGSSPELTNVTFLSNTADRDGGGMSNGLSNPVLTNVTFSDNLASRYGGGMYNWQSSPTLTNCILWANTAISAGHQISNSTASTPTIAYSDVEGSGGSGAWDGSLGDDGGGNLDADPLFVDAAAGDLRLHACSPAIDAGNNDGVTGTTDLDGHPRFVDVPLRADTGNGTAPIVDMGAYEFQLAQLPPAVFVDAGAAGANHGGSWAGAFTDLQDALHCASGSGEIWVAEGTYKPTSGIDRGATFQLQNGTELYGGFPSGGGVRNWALYATTLSGDIGTPDDSADNSYVVVTGSGTDDSALLDGFTITGGVRGGMANVQGSPTLRNLIFRDNSGLWGGGMHNDASSPTLTNCTFAGNSANQGGGMYNGNGSSPELTNCTFVGNSASLYGGGMENYNGSSPELTNCTFAGNSAQDGGGMDNWDDSSPTLTNCTFAGNWADGIGGGMYSQGGVPVLINCTFSRNGATKAGGMYNSKATPILTNCILWGDTPDEIFNQSSSSSPVVSYSDVQGGCQAIPYASCGDGNINTNPRFLDADKGDFHLGPCSPCIDAGDNVPALPAQDFEGDPRVLDGEGDGTATVDMGVDEAAVGSCFHVYLPLVTRSALAARRGGIQLPLKRTP
jgi:hypothetical protein